MISTKQTHWNELLLFRLGKANDSSVVKVLLNLYRMRQFVKESIRKSDFV